MLVLLNGIAEIAESLMSSLRHWPELLGLEAVADGLDAVVVGAE
jgi:hypothetical protein